MISPQNIEIKDEATSPGWLKHFFFMDESKRQIVKDSYHTFPINHEHARKITAEVGKALRFIKYDYYISTLEPSFSEKTGQLYFKAGAPIYMNDVERFWKVKAKEFAPEWKSRLAKWYELILFYAYRVATNKLPAEFLFGYMEHEEFLGYRNYSASRKIGGFFDGFDNTTKVTTTAFGYMESEFKYTFFNFYQASPYHFDCRRSGVIVLRKNGEKAVSPQIPVAEKMKKSDPPELKKATVYVAELKEISESFNFQDSDKIISSCVTKLYEILGKIKSANLQYNRFAYLFEVYLPQFSKILKTYATLLENQALEPKDKKLFIESVRNFYNFLHSQKVEAATDVEISKIEFTAAAKTLIRTLNNDQ